MSGFFPETQFLEEYERLSGLPVDRWRLKYYRVLVSFMSVAICCGTGYRVARGGKTHQDVVVGWLSMITYPLAEQMRATLEELL
jgi:aminoglycoside phosphotransferase (APT) family kinase protein